MTQERPGYERTRWAWRVAGYGGLLTGVALAALAAAIGAGGRTGLRFFLLGVLIASALGALIAVGTGALDSMRGHPVGRDRVVAAVVLGLVSLVLPAMLVGMGG